MDIKKAYPSLSMGGGRGLVNKNPVIAVKRPALRTVGFHTWTIEQVEQFRKFHPINTRARLALELMLFLGLRRSDVIRIGKGNVKDGVLSIRTQKTSKLVYIPIFKSLRDCIDAIGSDGETFCQLMGNLLGLLTLFIFGLKKCVPKLDYLSNAPPWIEKSGSNNSC